MLDQLVESKSNTRENTWRNSILMIVMILVFTSFVSGLGYSLFHQNLFVGGEGLELSTLVAPVPIPDKAPEPEPEKPKQKQINADVRKELIANIMETPPKTPKEIKLDQMKAKARRLNTPTIVCKNCTESSAFDRTKARPKQMVIKDDGFGNPGGGDSTVPRNNAGPAAPPPPPPVPKRISKGVVNGSAVRLPKPAYPATARAVNAKGAVNVAIVISKAGRVISARAVSGHPLLRRAAVSAARRARFRPTLLSGVPVEVSGVIVYNFQ